MMKLFTDMRTLYLVLLLLLPMGSANAAIQGTAGELSVIYFESGKPVPGAILRVGDNIVQLTNQYGSAHVIIPSGTYWVELTYRGKIILSTALLTIAGENTQIIASVPEPGKQADIEIETSDADDPTALAAANTQAADLGAGMLTGSVVSLENGKPLAGAQIYISGTQADVVSDDQGRFETELPVGSYSLSVILPGYAAVTIDDVTIAKDGQLEKTIELSPAGLELAEFVVLAPYIEGSVASIVQDTRDAAEVKEVLGAEQMSQAGDSDAASALQRVTGLTIEDGKYVVIRGQPSRYTLSLLNGSELPSPDPVRRVVPLDLFPTGVLAGIEVQKSYSADRPGSFGAGLVNLSLRGVPEESFAKISLGTGYNSQSTGKEGLTYDGGATDWLGVDDGTRELPSGVVDATRGGTVNLNSLPEEERNAVGKLFPNNYQVKRKTLGPDKSASIAAGTNVKTRFGEFGLMGNLSWGQKYRNIEETERDFALAAANEVRIQSEYEVERTTMKSGVGALVVAGAKWEHHAITSNTFFVRDTSMVTEIAEGENNTSDGRFERNHLLEWNQREMTVQQFFGKHDFSLLNVDWRLLTAAGNREAPDRRTYSYARQPDGSFIFYEETGAQRRYNTVEDDVNSFGVDVTIPLFDRESFAASVKTGLATYNQDRTSDTSRFRFEPGGAVIDLSPQNPEEIMNPENIGNGVEFADDTQPTDDYRGTATVNGQYLMTDLEFAEKLRINLGVRQESADFEVKTFASSATGSSEIVGGFSDSKLLPALSATWFMGDEMQMRLGYSTTVSRPVLVELSKTLFFDPDSGEAYIGNPDLKPAEIAGVDARWEWYFSTEEMFSIGAFYREYTNPIERKFQPAAGGGLFISFDNAESATVVGMEMGGRWSLSRLIDAMYLQSNITVMDSSVTLDNAGVATNTDRPLQGQADYVFNLQLGYDGEAHDWAVTFNQVGKRLDKAGVNGLPDIYREPVPELNAKWSWKFTEHAKFSLTGTNLLDPSYRYVGEDIAQRAYKKGFTIKSSISIEY